MHILDDVDSASLRSDIPDFRPGDTVKVHVRVVEGERGGRTDAAGAQGDEHRGRAGQEVSTSPHPLDLAFGQGNCYRCHSHVRSSQAPRPRRFREFPAR